MYFDPLSLYKSCTDSINICLTLKSKSIDAPNTTPPSFKITLAKAEKAPPELLSDLSFY